MVRYHTKRIMKTKTNLDLLECECYDINERLANNGLACTYMGYSIRVFKERNLIRIRMSKWFWVN
jgi:hypothetical protein